VDVLLGRRVAAWAVVGLVLGASGMAAAQTHFTDSFESYPTGVWPCEGPGCVGANGWGLWYYTYSNGPQPGRIVEGNAHSGARALRLRPYTDIVRREDLTSGRWRVRIQSYFPSNHTASADNAYFILLNECQSTPPVSFSLMVLFEGPSGLIKSTTHPGAGAIPIALDQWVELRIDVDLNAGRQSVYYGGNPFFVDLPYASSGRRALECLAIYSDGVDGVLFDTVSVEELQSSPPPAPSCYPNCDGSTSAPMLDVADFTCFMNRYMAGQPYANCDGSTRPPTLTITDFLCFMRRFASGCP
jgi:hypothetical protein